MNFITLLRQDKGNIWVLLVTIAGLFFIALAPVFYITLGYGASYRWIFLGAFSWGLGVGLKGAVWYGCLQDPVGRLSVRSAFLAAGCEGLWSGIAELSVTAWFYFYPRLPSRLEAIAFGIGAGAMEVFYFIYFFFQELLEGELTKERQPSLNLMTWNIFERACALVFHTASRALLYLTVSRVNLFPALIALVGFVLIDGAAGYGVMRKWKWTDYRVLMKFYAWALTVTAVVSWACWILW